MELIADVATRNTRKSKRKGFEKMPRKRKKRKTRVTKELIEKERAKRKTKPNKKKAIPGPWTEIDTSLEVKARLRLNNGIVGECYGNYPKHGPVVKEKGWYLILFNLTSKSIKRDVEKHGLDNYIAACERSLNEPENEKQYGKIVILEVTVDNSRHSERDHRFISCYAKTNKKSISGFTAIRDKVYQVLP